MRRWAIEPVGVTAIEPIGPERTLVTLYQGEEWRVFDAANDDGNGLYFVDKVEAEAVRDLLQQHELARAAV